jgi:hypothetical protein
MQARHVNATITAPGKALPFGGISSNFVGGGFGVGKKSSLFGSPSAPTMSSLFCKLTPD